MKLLTEFELGDLKLKNRFVLAPMTRSRAIEGNVPNPLAVEYYRQRSTAGLIITEASQVSPQGVGYIDTPGIHSLEQVEGWKKITRAVHEAGAKIYLQLWHVGRVSHPDFHGGELPVGPSAIAADGEAYTRNGRQKLQAPRALQLKEIAGIVDQFREGALNARLAGFDGVEIHGANGYLPDQFLRDGSNVRKDRYGGSIANRARFALEVTEAVTSVWGPERVGYRISPLNPYNSMKDSNPRETLGFLVRELSAMKLGYLHMVESADTRAADRLAPSFRELFRGALIINCDYGRDAAEQAVESGLADLVAFGVPYLANPDLPERFRRGAPLNAADPATFYGGGAHGYPALG